MVDNLNDSDKVVESFEVPFACTLIVNKLKDGSFEVYPEHGENIKATDTDLDFAVGEVLKESAWYLEFASEHVRENSREAKQRQFKESQERRRVHELEH